MFGNQSFDRVREIFAGQFEPDGNNYIYRKNMKDAPIQVSADEHARFIATFNNYIKYGFWGLIGGIVFLVILTISYTATTGTILPDTTTYVGISLIMAAFMAGYYWAWNLPSRELRGRGTVGVARSRAEIRRQFLAKLTYGQIAALAATVVLATWRIVGNGDWLSGWNLVWLAMAVIVLILAAVQAFLKWRFNSAQN